LFRFEEHDVFLPLITLEELDNHKKGMTEVARHARQVSRNLDLLLEDGPSRSNASGKAPQVSVPSKDSVQDVIKGGIPLNKLGNADALGKLYVQTSQIDGALPSTLPVGKADNQILSVVNGLAKQLAPMPVVLVSKDINMRIKARAVGMLAEDYFNDQVLEDTDLLYSGILPLPNDFWDKHGKGVESWQQGGSTYYRVTGPIVAHMLVNQFVFCEAGIPLVAQVKEVQGRTAVLQTLRDYSHNKNAVWGVTARNREQNFAINLLMNPECDFVSILGQAGTGKTLLTLAAGLAQTLESKLYSEIIVTRATVPVGEDIGFLPGTEEEKMAPWMGALEDNLEVLNKSDTSVGDWGRSATQDLIRTKIRIKSMNFMRGRTFVNKFLIIDEAQNLTPKQMKTLITRAGPGTKVVCLGNIAQIDTPYLTEGSSGLTFVVDRFKGWGHAGHITLQRGERSRLADFAAEVL
jgi:PhoH-like ATPase